MKDMTHQSQTVLSELDDLLARAKDALRARVTVDGRVDADALERHQHAAHALSWLASYVMSLRQLADWSARVDGPVEALITRIGMGEYLTQILGGIPMSQTEFARLSDLGVTWQPSEQALSLMAGNTPEARAELAALMARDAGAAIFGASGLDEDLEMIRRPVWPVERRQRSPPAHGWHLKDQLIPMEIIEEMAELGVFGPTIPEEFGGLGLSKAAMVVVSEELSRGYIGVGSLGTRSGDTKRQSDPRAAAPRGAEGTGWLRLAAQADGSPLRSSPNPTPAATWAACAPARSGTATIGW